MNFMDGTEKQQVQVDLKYCERCGGLWLRPQTTDSVHCRSCRLRLEARSNPGPAKFQKMRSPEVQRRKAPKQKPDVRPDGRKDRLPSPAEIDCLQGVAAVEVRA